MLNIKGFESLRYFFIKSQLKRLKMYSPFEAINAIRRPMELNTRLSKVNIISGSSKRFTFNAKKILKRECTNEKTNDGRDAFKIFILLIKWVRKISEN